MQTQNGFQQGQSDCDDTPCCTFHQIMGNSWEWDKGLNSSLGL